MGVLHAFADLTKAIQAFLESVSRLNLGAPSDYGRVFYGLRREAERYLTRNTLLVVLGDGRTNVYDPLGWAFEETAARVKKLIWMVPEPRERWGTGDSALDDYLPHVDTAVEASDLAGLARGLAEMARGI